MRTETATNVQGGRAERLLKLGFKTAATELAVLIDTKRKLALAYEHYRFVTPEKVAAFNVALMQKTGKNMKSISNMEYQRLDFTPIAQYRTVPPDSVLASLETAQKRKCFDSFEIAYIKNVKDPLLFGRVDGTPNRFFIDQWDDDVKIEDLLKENEG